jgi:hypothetical protein
MGLHLSRAEAAALGIEVPKAHKYGARKTVLDDWTFDSWAEATRYAMLAVQAKAGMIRNLVVHPKFPIEVHGVQVCHYVGDFAYIEGQTPRQVVEDVKGVLTAVYSLKKRMFKAAYPQITLREVRRCRGSRSSRPAFTTTDV